MTSSLSMAATAATATATASSTFITVRPGYGAKPTGGVSPDANAHDDPSSMAPQLTPEQLHEDRSYQIYTAVSLLYVFGTFFFACRIGSRFVTRVRPKASDWILLAGIVCSFAMGGCYIWSAKSGAGSHFQSLAMEDLQRAEMGIPFKAQFIATELYFAGISLIKLSVLALFYEVFSSSRPFRIAVWCVTALVVSWWLGFAIFIPQTCTPISDVWDLSANNKHDCIEGPHFLTNGVTNILIDLLILILPTRMVWHMQLPTKTKWALSVVFLLGGIVVIASTFRLAYTMLVKNLDPSFDVVVLELWSCIELIVAIAAACLLTMRPLLKRAIPAWVLSVYSRRTGRSSPAGAGRPSSGAAAAGRHRSWYTPRHSRYKHSADGRNSSGPGGTLVEDAGLDMDGLYVGRAAARHAVSTRITAALKDPYALDDYGVLGEYRGVDGIKVTQEGPVYTVEGRLGSTSDGHAGSLTDVEEGRTDGESEKNTGTRDLWTKE